MLSLDIETMGLKNCPVTMVCMYDQNRNFQVSYPFVTCQNCETGEITNEEQWKDWKDEIIFLLNDADTICAFNGIEFDLPFLANYFEVEDEMLGQWICKTVDIFYAVKQLTNRWFKLSTLLEINDLESKSGTGIEAIEWAKNNEVEKLQDYCMQDTIMTWKLFHLEKVKIPIEIDNKTLCWNKTNLFLEAISLISD